MLAKSVLLCGVLLGAICAYQLPWTDDVVMTWADFGTNQKTLFTDYQSKFIGDHYRIISLEKCLGNTRVTGMYTEQAFYEAAAGIRQYVTSEQTKILFYWNIQDCYCDCYESTQYILTNSSMWLYDDNGNPMYAGGDTQRPLYDMTQEFVRDWWLDTLIDIIQTGLDQNITIDGIFADGLCPIFNSHQINSERQTQYTEGVRLLMAKTKIAFRKINDDLVILGNGIVSYPQRPDHCLIQVPSVDGLCIEHFGSFEEVNTHTGQINPDDLLMWYNVSNSIMDGDYGPNKFIAVKSWIGPEVSPINGMGPSWPAAFAPTPTTHLEIQNASASLIDFPLAVFLCGMHRENVFLSYGWWYDISQGYAPCPDAPTTCDCPPDWYPSFTYKLGKAQGPGVMTDTYICSRDFEHAQVSVDLRDDSSAVIVWDN